MLVLKLVFTSTGMETEEPPAPAEKKEAPKRRGAAKKMSSAIVLDDSDSDNEIHDVEDDDDNFEIMQPVALEAGKKKGGRKPAAQNAKKAPAAAARKRNVGGKQSQFLGQKLITDMLESTGISPEKKVRKMRASPFNKKSSSVLGRVAAADKDDSVSEDLSGDSAGSSPRITEEVVEIAPPPARARPQRANRRQTTYVLSESESDNDSDVDEDYSDFEEDED